MSYGPVVVLLVRTSEGAGTVTDNEFVLCVCADHSGRRTYIVFSGPQGRCFFKEGKNVGVSRHRAGLAGDGRGVSRGRCRAGHLTGGRDCGRPMR